MNCFKPITNHIPYRTKSNYLLENEKADKLLNGKNSPQNSTYSILVKGHSFRGFENTTGSCGKRGYSPKITSDFRELLVKAVFLVGCTSYVQLIAYEFSRK